MPVRRALTLYNQLTVLIHLDVNINCRNATTDDKEKTLARLRTGTPCLS